MLTLGALALIPTSINSSLWAGLLEDFSLAFSEECNWKGFVATMGHGRKLTGKLWSAHPEALSWNTG